MSRDRSAVGLPPIRKSLGQHFLSEPRILGRIADALGLAASDTVIEIGPGRGALTDMLVARAQRTIAIEYDRKLATLLRERFAGNDRVEIVQADVLEVDLGAAARGRYKLVGNVPYYITTPILFHALRPPRADVAVYLVQREVAERIAAQPGDRDYGAISVNVQAAASVEVLFRVPAGAFHPPPKVESAVIRLVPLAEPVITTGEEQRFRVLVRGAFGFRRKQMRRVVRELRELSAADADDLLQCAGIEPDARPETIAPGQFARLLRALPAD